jgi:hypothetical protein
MSKRILIYFLFFLIFSTKIRADIHIVYVDFGKTKRLDLLTKELSGLNISATDKILFFISNDARPIIFTDLAELTNNFKKMSYLTPSKPDFFDDLDSLNSTVSLYQLIPINYKNTDKVQLHFFFNYERFEDRKLDEGFIQKFLLCNQLSNYIKKDNINFKVSVYLDNANLDKLDYVENLKKSSNYTFYEY